VSSWNPFDWEFWSGSSTGAAAVRETHQQVISQGHSEASHERNAGGRYTISVPQREAVRE
jgi:hypothetical protein